jgi:3-hydroxyisobutyrate dehydrogenase-like beta-hydroxyacid dehydrogenase
MSDAVVGLVGLGVMGSAIGNLLIASGAEVWGYDVASARHKAFEAAGGNGARSVADVARHCPVVLTSLPSVEAFRAVVCGPDGLVSAGQAGQAGLSLVIELSTLPLADKLAGYDMLAGIGCALADAPLSGTGAQAKTGDLVAFVSADTAGDRDRATAVLRRFTRAQYDVGEFGNGSKFKYVANLLVAIHNVAAAEALVLAERAGLDLATVLAAIGDGAGTSRMFEIRGPLMAGRAYEEATVRLEVFLKDVSIIGDFAAQAGVHTPLFDASRQVYQTALARGRADQDTACVAEVLREDAS